MTSYQYLPDGLEGWKKKRRQTTLVHFLFYFLTGIERSANTATLWIYVTTLLETDNPKTAYGFINTSIYFAPIFISPFIARVVDKTRHLKLTLTIICITAIIGNFVYLIRTSFFFPFFGKFLNGFVTCARPLIVGETARVYPSNELQAKLPMLVTASAIGFAIGPCVVSLFTDIKWEIGALVITYGNVSAVVLLVLTFIVLIIHIFISSDVSKEFDLKGYNMQMQKEIIADNDNSLPPSKPICKLNDERDQTNKETRALIETCKTESLSWKKVSLMLLRKPELLILFLLTLYVSYLSVALFRFVPVLMFSKMKLSELAVNGWFLGHAILSFITLVVAIKSKPTPSSSFYYILFSLIQMVLLWVTLIIPDQINYKNIYGNITAVTILNIFYTGFEIGEHVFIVVVVAKLVQPDKQCFVESLRISFKHIGSILGAFTSAYIVDNLIIFSSVILFFSLFIGLVLLRYSYLYKNPVTVI